VFVDDPNHKGAVAEAKIAAAEAKIAAAALSSASRC
jgi:hypothetical protein